MSRIYTVPYTGTLTAAGGDSDLVEIQAGDDRPCRLRGWIIGQTSEVGDAAEENIRLSVIRLPATLTSGSGGTPVTPVPLDAADAAAGFTAECNNTTVATTSSTAVTLMELAWNERATPFEFWFPDERFCPVAKQGEGLVVRNQTTIADDLTIAMVFFVEEL